MKTFPLKPSLEQTQQLCQVLYTWGSRPLFFPLGQGIREDEVYPWNRPWLAYLCCDA